MKTSWTRARSWLSDSIPFVSMITTGVIEGRNLLAGRATLQEALSRGARRIGKAAAYDALGTVTGLGPGMIAVRIAEMRLSGRVALGDLLESRTEEIRQLRPLSTGEYGTLPALEGRRVAAT